MIAAADLRQVFCVQGLPSRHRINMNVKTLDLYLVVFILSWPQLRCIWNPVLFWTRSPATDIKAALQDIATSKSPAR